MLHCVFTYTGEAENEMLAVQFKNKYLATYDIERKSLNITGNVITNDFQVSSGLVNNATNAYSTIV
jgi:hypothetical protein